MDCVFKLGIADDVDAPLLFGCCFLEQLGAAGSFLLFGYYFLRLRFVFFLHICFRRLACFFLNSFFCFSGLVLLWEGVAGTR